MKTIREWLEELPEPYRTQAIDNTMERELSQAEPSMHEAILGAFVWEETIEGFYYWAKLHHKFICKDIYESLDN